MDTDSGKMNFMGFTLDHNGLKHGYPQGCLLTVPASGLFPAFFPQYGQGFLTA
jgi:hypothetical protein